MFITKHNMPRWLIFLIDMSIVSFSIILAYLLRFNFHIPDVEIKHLPQVFGVVLGIRAISFIISKTYAGIIRYTSTEDAVRIFIVLFSGSILFGALNLLSYYFINDKFIIPFSIIIIEFLSVILGMVT